MRRYFNKSYPARGSLLAKLGFRRCHSESVEFVVSLNLPLDGGWLLDYGCGDGEFLASVLGSGGGASAGLSVRLEDIAARELTHAGAVVSPLVARVDAVLVGDSSEDSRADVVLAMGVLDYYLDWSSRLVQLAARADQFLVFTMPKRRLIGHVPRRLWLRAHGLSICRTTRAELEKLQRVVPGRWRIEEDQSTFYCCVGFQPPGS